MEKKRPYIGITGPINTKEVDRICEYFDKSGYSMDSDHIPMLGFLASHKTLNKIPVKNRRYPPIDTLPELLLPTKNKVFSTIHYNTKKKDTLFEQINSIFDGIYHENLCRGLQLNIPWPDMSEIGKIKDIYPEMKIIFQASEEVLQSSSLEGIATRIKSYGDLIDYVLIDPSGGKGIPFDLKKSYSFYDAISEKSPHLTIGFAGGFSGKNAFPVIKSLEEKLGDSEFSIDAEGGLRDKLSEKYGDDLLNFSKVESYLCSASSVLF